MKIIIAGSRTIRDYQFTKEFVLSLPIVDKITEVVCGTALGPDRHGELLAKEMGWKVAYFPADWDEHGKRAGVIRNCQMGNYADAAAIIWDGVSRGSSHMLGYMEKLGKPTYLKTRSPPRPMAPVGRLDI